MDIKHKRNLGRAVALSLICVAIPAMAFASPEGDAVPRFASSSQRAAALPAAAQARLRGDVGRLGRAHTRPSVDRLASGRSARLQHAGASRIEASTLTAPAAVDPAPGPASGPVQAGRPDWYAIAACESGGGWHLNTGNGYWGGLQFAPGTWFANGGGRFDGTGPFPYSPAQQIAVAERVFSSQGPGAWPNCFRWA